MQRDQALMIDAWCRYHGHLFGFENLTVLDNGSVLPETVETLRRYQRAGSTVLWQYRSAADHADRQSRIEDVARRDGGPQALAVWLDCDEWLGLFTADGLSCDRDEIMAYLDRPGWAWPGAFGIEGALVNVPTAPGWFCSTPFSRRCWTTGTGVSGGAVQSTDFVVVRFSNRPFSASGPADAVHVAGEPGVRSVVQCRRFFAGRLLVEFASLAALADAVGMPGGLLPPPSRDDAAPARVMMPARGGRGGRRAVVFDAAAYLLVNADVAAAGWPALEHFVRHGAVEGRGW